MEKITINSQEQKPFLTLKLDSMQTFELINALRCNNIRYHMAVKNRLAEIQKHKDNKDYVAMQEFTINRLRSSIDTAQNILKQIYTEYPWLAPEAEQNEE